MDTDNLRAHKESAMETANWELVFYIYARKPLTLFYLMKEGSRDKINEHAQGRGQPHRPGWARVPLSTFLPQILVNFSYFSSNCTYFHSHFDSPGGRLAHPGRSWLYH